MYHRLQSKYDVECLFLARLHICQHKNQGPSHIFNMTCNHPRGSFTDRRAHNSWVTTDILLEAKMLLTSYTKTHKEEIYFINIVIIEFCGSLLLLNLLAYGDRNLGISACVSQWKNPDTITRIFINKPIDKISRAQIQWYLRRRYRLVSPIEAMLLSSHICPILTGMTNYAGNQHVTSLPPWCPTLSQVLPRCCHEAASCYFSGI